MTRKEQLNAFKCGYFDAMRGYKPIYTAYDTKHSYLRGYKSGRKYGCALLREAVAAENRLLADKAQLFKATARQKKERP